MWFSRHLLKNEASKRSKQVFSNFSGKLKIHPNAEQYCWSEFAYRGTFNDVLKFINNLKCVYFCLRKEYFIFSYPKCHPTVLNNCFPAVPFPSLCCIVVQKLSSKQKIVGMEKKIIHASWHLFLWKKKLNIFHWCKQTPDLLKIKMNMKKEKQSDSFCRSPWCWNIETHSFLFSFSILAVQLQLHVTVSYSAYTPEHLGQH